MQRYMKSAMPFHGVRAPAVAAVMKQVVAEHPLPDRTMWEATVRTLWDEATHREERYGAIALTGARPYRPYQDPAALPLYRDLVVTGAWWDFVDEVAVRRVGPIRRESPAEVDPVLRAWAVDDDLWLRRVAILSQVGRKVHVDHDLLVDVLAPNLGHPDFFVRKAIGWVVRDVPGTSRTTDVPWPGGGGPGARFRHR